MTVAVSKRAMTRTVTPEDLLAMPDGGKGFELVGGRLVEKNMGGFASWAAAQICHHLIRFAELRGLGWVFDSEGSYQCFRDEPRKVRKPDVSFIRRGRLPHERIPAGHIKIPPDLAVEVVSRHDTVYELDTKVEEYLAAGVPLVWVVNPEIPRVHVYRADGSVARLGESDELTAPELVPDLRCRLADLFAAPPAA